MQCNMQSFAHSPCSIRISSCTHTALRACNPVKQRPVSTARSAHYHTLPVDEQASDFHSSYDPSTSTSQVEAAKACRHPVSLQRRWRAVQKVVSRTARLARAWRKLRKQLIGQRQSLHLPLSMAAFVPSISAAEGGLGLSDLLSNRVFMAGFVAWFIAQVAKGVTTAIALQYGLGSPLFAIAICFSVIVMYDAMGVRWHAGNQAKVLNQVINELLDDHQLSSTKLKEVLGHTPRQVCCGAILGFIIGFLYPAA